MYLRIGIDTSVKGSGKRLNVLEPQNAIHIMQLYGLQKIEEEDDKVRTKTHHLTAAIPLPLYLL